MIGIQITKNSFRRKLVSFLILIKMILPLGSAVFITDSRVVEGSLALMIKRSGFSKAFRIDPLCGVFSTRNKRRKKCQEVLNSEDFKRENPDIIYNTNNANLPLKSCKSYEPFIVNAAQDVTLSFRKITMTMFECPFQRKDGSDQGVYYMSLGSASDTLFLFTDLEDFKKPVGWYSSKPFQGN